MRKVCVNSLVLSVFVIIISFGQAIVAQDSDNQADATSKPAASAAQILPVASPAKEPVAPQQTRDAKTSFQAGVAAYKKHDLNEAKADFIEFLGQIKSSEAYYDLGLVEYDQKNLGPAVAYWRKAVELDPHNELAQNSLSFIQKRIEHPELNRQNDSFEVLREKVLNYTKVEYLILLTALIFAAFGWLFLAYLGERKRSREQELPPPSLPWISMLLFCFLALTSTLSAAKLYDLTIPRATVLPPKIAVYSAPDSESTELFELFEGLEVVVEATQGDYVQVTFPGGMTGWTLKKNLMPSSGSES